MKDFTFDDLLEIKNKLHDEDSRLVDQIHAAHDFCFNRNTLDCETHEKIVDDIQLQREPVLAMIAATKEVISYHFYTKNPLPFMSAPSEPDESTKALVAKAYRLYFLCENRGAEEKSML